MAKTTRKQKILIIISLIIIAAICAAFVNFYKEKNYWQEDAARYNRYYINAKVFSCTSGLYPAFNGDGTYTRFLDTYYVSLAQDIMSNHNLSDEEVQEATKIFKEATVSLKELTSAVLKMTETQKNKIALRKVGSPIYNKAEEMIREYCNKYGKMISDFNRSNNNAKCDME